MLKDATYKDKFALLHPWMPRIVDEIKKELRNDHLRTDPGFVKEFFSGKNPAKMSSEELAEGYLEAIARSERSDDIGEFIANRWLLKNSDLYYHFEQELAKIHPNFSELETIDAESAAKIVQSAVGQFGALPTYLFCVLNSVVFPREIFDKMARDAQLQASAKASDDAAAKERQAMEKEQRDHAQEIARLTDKYEKRIQGLLKKYTLDTEALKKQIAVLQRKIAG